MEGRWSADGECDEEEVVAAEGGYEVWFGGIVDLDDLDVGASWKGGLAVGAGEDRYFVVAGVEKEIQDD